MKHDPYQCRPTGNSHYSFRNWSREYGCPKCGRVGYHNQNFLGQRAVICDGEKFIKAHMTFGALRDAGIDIKTLRALNDPISMLGGQ